MPAAITLEALQVGDIETVGYAVSVDPGDGDTILVYVDATPAEDVRRAQLADVVQASPSMHTAITRFLDEHYGNSTPDMWDGLQGLEDAVAGL